MDYCSSVIVVVVAILLVIAHTVKYPVAVDH